MDFYREILEFNENIKMTETAKICKSLQVAWIHGGGLKQWLTPGKLLPLKHLGDLRPENGEKENSI